MNYRYPSLSLLCALFTSLACNSGGSADDGDPPASCDYEGQTIEDGEEFEALDGCQTLLCSDGVVEAVEDRRVTIEGDLELVTQDAVDEQACLAVVEGSLRITGTAADLTPLATLDRIGGRLEIVASETVSLAGLEGMTEVGEGITITDNPALTTLSFQTYLSAFGDVTIQNNDALASLAGAEFIGQCTSCIAALGGPSELSQGRDAEFEPGADIGPEQSGGTFYGNILIAENDVLTDVQAIANLYYAWSDVRFRNNAALGSLAGLQLMEVRGDLEISGHASMPTADADAFALDVNVLGSKVICGNMGGEACP